MPPLKNNYDLEDRCLQFAKEVQILIKTLPRSISNIEYAKQLIRSSASIGANYIEANEKLSKKDFILRARIAKKEARETRYWLKLIDLPTHQDHHRLKLIQESTEITSILATIINKFESNNLS